MLPSTSLYSNLFLPFEFPHQNSICISLHAHALHMPIPFHQCWLEHANRDHSLDQSVQTYFVIHPACYSKGTGQLKCDGTQTETRFPLSAKRTSPFKSAGASVQSTTGSRGVRISGSNAEYTMFRDSVKSTGYPLHSSFSPFTSHPVRHLVPSHFNWSLPRFFSWGKGVGAWNWLLTSIYCRGWDRVELDIHVFSVKVLLNFILIWICFFTCNVQRVRMGVVGQSNRLIKERAVQKR
jgi:hypothetical protein